MRWIQDRLSNFRVEDIPGGWLGLVSACASAYVSYRMCVYGHYRYRVAETKRKIRGRQEIRTQNILEATKHVQSHQGTFDPSITKLEFKELQGRLQKGDITARDVLLAFQLQALDAHQDLNCVTEFLDDAMDRALKLDQVPAHLRGPLHGIPISLKEGVVLARRDATIGFASSIGKKFEEDSVLIRVLVGQGAVPFVRTNLPQAQMSFECSNPIFGVTRNPKNTNRTSGGSSGGEGALIGRGASVMGLGCDMGGSIRVPAHFCGIVGIKCTPNRLSAYLAQSSHGIAIHLTETSTTSAVGRKKWKLVAEVYSPLGRDVDSVVEFMKAALGPKLYELDPLIPRMPWNEQLYRSTKPLKIGVYTWDGGVEPVPAVQRAVMLAKKNLQDLGHEVVGFQPPDVLYMFEHLFMSVISGDGGKEVLQALKYDTVDPCIRAIVQGFEAPPPSFVKKLISLLPGMHPVTKILINYDWPRDIAAWWSKNEELEAYRRKFSSKMISEEIDCLVCPTLPFPAWPVELAEHNFESCTYTTLYNVLDFPAGVVPTTTVTAKDVEDMKSYPDHTDVHRYVHQITKDSEGLPVGVQCVGLPFEEETVLRLMKDLETSLQAMTS